MKLLKYFAAVLAFSIYAVSFEFSEKHYDYVKGLKPEERSFVVIGLLALEEKYGDSTDYDTSTLSISINNLNELIWQAKKGYEESEIGLFPEFIHSFYEHFFSTFPSGFWDLEFDADIEYVNELASARELDMNYNAFCGDPNIPSLIVSCFKMTLNVNAMTLYQINLIDFTDSSSCLVLDYLYCVCSPHIADFIDNGKKINCKKVNLDLFDGYFCMNIDPIKEFLLMLNGLHSVCVGTHQLIGDKIINELVELCSQNGTSLIEYGDYDMHVDAFCRADSDYSDD